MRWVEVLVGPGMAAAPSSDEKARIGIDLGEVAMFFQPTTVKRSACEPLGIWSGEMRLFQNVVLRRSRVCYHLIAIKRRQISCLGFDVILALNIDAEREHDRSYEVARTDADAAIDLPRKMRARAFSIA